MEKSENEYAIVSKSYCRVGKITAKENLEDDLEKVLIDLKVEDCKKSIEDFTEENLKFNTSFI